MGGRVVEVKLIDQRLNLIEAKLDLILAKPVHMLFCSFCNKRQKDCSIVITGNNVAICNECVNICCEIIAEKKAEEKEKE